jgi:hypothetical protein
MPFGVEGSYIPEDDMYLRPYLWPPNGLAEENIFQLVGYMSPTDLSAVHRDDPFLAGNAWVFAPDGREHFLSQEIN